MSTIKSSTEHLTLNADGAGKEIKFQANGVEVAKVTSDSVSLGDNVKANFGASDDLQIYHDGSHSYVSDQGTGRLVLNSSGGGVRIEKSPSENMAIFTPDGNCELFYDNALKLATTSTGVDVTGSVTCDGLSIAGNSYVGGGNTFTDSTSGYFFGGNDSFTNGVYGVGTNNVAIAANGSERMRITSAGATHIGRSAGGFGTAGCSFVTSGDVQYMEVCNKHPTDASSNIYINRENNADALSFFRSSSSVGSIRLTTTSTSYVTSSDYRLKENVVPMTGSIDRLKDLKPSRFNFKADTDTTVDGFLAHEAAVVVPECATGTKDAMMDEEYEVTPAVMDGETVVTEAVMGTRSVPDYQGIDQSKLVPLLVASLQEAVAKIESLEARVTALEV